MALRKRKRKPTFRRPGTPEWEEHEHPRAEGGRFGAKPDAPDDQAARQVVKPRGPLAAPPPAPGASSDMQSYLGMVANIKKGQPNAEQWQLDNGRDWDFDSSSFKGGTPHQCYMNAANAAIADPDLTYVEGYVAVHGVPIQHAWVVDKAGKVRDVTIGDGGRGIQGYYGTPIKTSFLSKRLLDSKMYGLLPGKPKDMLATIQADPSESVQPFPKRPKAEAPAPAPEPEDALPARPAPKMRPATIEQAARKIRVFHGTSSKVLASIRRDGLRPNASEGADAWLESTDPDEWALIEMADMEDPDRLASVFVAKAPSYAREYAAKAAEITGAEPIVLVVDVPKGVLKRDQMGRVLPPFVEYMHKGPIPPEWIVGTIDPAQGKPAKVSLFEETFVDPLLVQGKAAVESAAAQSAAEERELEEVSL